MDKKRKKELRKIAYCSLICSLGLTEQANDAILRNCSSLEEFTRLDENSLNTMFNCDRKTIDEILDFLKIVEFNKFVESSVKSKKKLSQPSDKKNTCSPLVDSFLKFENQTPPNSFPVNKTPPKTSLSSEPSSSNDADWHRLTASFGLSVRATNVLLNNYDSFEDLKDITLEKLLTYKNCGRKTAKELLKFASTEIKAIDNTPTPTVKESLASPPNEASLSLLPIFSNRQLKGINEVDLHPGFHTSTKLSDLILPARTTNVFNTLDIKTIGNLIFFTSKNLLRQQNFGKKSLEAVRQLVHSLCLSNDNLNKSTITAIDYSSYESMIGSFLQETEKNKRNQEIFLKRLCFQEGKLPTLEELGIQFDVSRERIRQILKRGTLKFRIKGNIDRLKNFWLRLDTLVQMGGGIIHLGALPAALQAEFNWPTAPYSLALGQFLLLRSTTSPLKKEDDLLKIESNCFSCKHPLQWLHDLDFEKNESIHIEVVATTLSDKCSMSCPWKQPVTYFHRAFIKHIIEQTEGRLTFHEELILPYDSWIGIYSNNLEEVACHVLEKQERPMHFTKIAEIISRTNNNFSALTTRNIHASIMRYEQIEIINRGIYGLKSWGLGGYRSVSTAIEQLIDKKGIPQKKQQIIQQLGGEFSERNITAALSAETRFINIGNGFYDLPQHWSQRTLDDLIALLPGQVNRFSRYLTGRKNSSYKLVMSFIFIRSMDENGTLHLHKLKEMFYNFYRTRHKKGLIVETGNTVMCRIGELPAVTMQNRATVEPLNSFKNSEFFIAISKNSRKLKITDCLLAEFKDKSVRNILLITLLKAIDDYFKKISLAVAPLPPSTIEQRHISEATEVTQNISIKKKGRGKIKL